MPIVAVGHPMLAAGAPGEVHDTALNPIGVEAWFYDTDNDVYKKYVYLKGVANTVLGAFVTYDEAGVTAGIDTDVADTCSGPVAVATAAVVADKFGWYGRKGSFSGLAAAIADNAIVYATSTVFSVDDVAVANMQIVGAKSRSATSGGLATFQLSDPWIGVDESAA